MKSITINRATLSDIEFIADTIIAAEKGGTENFGLAKLFEVDEKTMREYIIAMLEEEIDGCEMSLSSFLVARHDGKPIAAFAGWVEGDNDYKKPSSILKSNLIAYTLPQECILLLQDRSEIVNPLQIEREAGTYQLEYSYTLPNYRGRNIMGAIIDEHIKLATHFGVKKIQVHVFNNNTPAQKTYEKKGFLVIRKYKSQHPLNSNYFPSNVELLMEKTL